MAGSSPLQRVGVVTALVLALTAIACSETITAPADEAILAPPQFNAAPGNYACLGPLLRNPFFDQTMVMTSAFGPRFVATGSPMHPGIDLRAQTPLMLVAPAAGVIEKSVHNPTQQRGKGSWIRIRLNHVTNFAIEYFHMSQINVTEGDVVAAGDVVGVSGQSGAAGSPHLHLEYLRNGQRLNPQPCMLGYVEELRITPEWPAPIATDGHLQLSAAVHVLSADGLVLPGCAAGTTAGCGGKRVVYWRSLDETIATVDSTGRVSAAGVTGLVRIEAAAALTSVDTVEVVG
jgi:murein DD-endopeptidase MepM/ murein hydrolase activator NlpD